MTQSSFTSLLVPNPKRILGTALKNYQIVMQQFNENPFPDDANFTMQFFANVPNIALPQLT